MGSYLVVQTGVFWESVSTCSLKGKTMKTRHKVLLVLTAVVIGLTVLAILMPPAQIMPERTIGVIYHGHRASYTLPAEYELGLLFPWVIFAWAVYVQVVLPLCLHPWEKRTAFGHSM